MVVSMISTAQLTDCDVRYRIFGECQLTAAANAHKEMKTCLVSHCLLAKSKDATIMQQNYNLQKKPNLKYNYLI